MACDAMQPHPQAQVIRLAYVFVLEAHMYTVKVEDARIVSSFRFT